MKNLIILLVLVIVTETLFSQEKIRGTITKGVDKKTTIGINYILTIGIDNYANWNKLSNAVNDAQGVHNLFSNSLGYVPVAKPLLNKNANKKSILSLIENKLPNLLTENDNLVIFFAGHGESFERKVGTKSATIGYIIPEDGGHPSKNNFNSYLKADELMGKINELPAKHILLILDACKSGIAIKTQKWRSNTYSEDLKSRMSRKVITSAMSNQVASDDGPIPNHSLFTGTLINGFKTGMIDKGDRNGVVTTSEIGLYLQQLVAQNSKATIKQTPDFGAFGFDDRGEMVIDLNDDSLFALKAKINGAMQSGSLSRAWKNLELLISKYPEDPEIDYYLYRKSIYEYKIDKALLHANKLLNFIDKSDSKYYLSSSTVWKLKQQLPYWKNVLEIKTRNNDLKIKVHIYPEIDKNGNNTTKKAIIKNENLKGNLDIIPYEIKPETSFTIEIENKSKIPQYLYCIYYDFNGSFEVVPIFNDYDVIDFGLPVNRKVESYKYVQDGAIGIEKISIYSSSKRIRELERPMNINSRGASKPFEKITDFEVKKNDVFLLFK